MPSPPSSVRHVRSAHALALRGLALLLVTLTLAPRAHAQDFVLHVEPGAAMWLDVPQVRRLVPGFHLGVRPGVTLGRITSLQLSYGLLVARPREDFTEPLSAHEVKFGARVRPLALLADPSDGLVQPRGVWIDTNLGYVRTGRLDRFGFDVGLGYDFQVARWATVGAYMRYAHVVQPDERRGADPRDGQLIAVGLCLSAGRLPRQEPAVDLPVPD